MATNPGWAAFSADAAAITNVNAVKTRTLTIIGNLIVASLNAGALLRTISPHHVTARARAASSAFARTLVFWDHEFQSRPGLVDGADLDVDEAKRQRGVAHHDIAEIGSNA